MTCKVIYKYIKYLGKYIKDQNVEEIILDYLSIDYSSTIDNILNRYINSIISYEEYNIYYNFNNFARNDRRSPYNSVVYFIFGIVYTSKLSESNVFKIENIENIKRKFCLIFSTRDYRSSVYFFIGIDFNDKDEINYANQYFAKRIKQFVNLESLILEGT